MRADHQLAPAARHRRDDDAIEAGFLRADDPLHVAIGGGHRVCGVELEPHQSQLGLVRDVGGATLDHDRAMHGPPRFNGFRLAAAQLMWHDADVMLGQ